MNINFKIAETVNRKRAKDQGYFDGRFRSKTILDKKKNAYFKLRKNKVKMNEML
jgi:hypothetical protein